MQLCILGVGCTTPSKEVFGRWKYHTAAMRTVARLKQVANDCIFKASSAVAQAAPPAEQAAAEGSEAEHARGQVLDAAL